MDSTTKKILCHSEPRNADEWYHDQIREDIESPGSTLVSSNFTSALKRAQSRALKVAEQYGIEITTKRANRSLLIVTSTGK